MSPVHASLYGLASLLFAMANEAEFWTDDLGYRQAARRVIVMARGFCP